MDKKDPLRLKNQLCFPLYACARQVVNVYRPFLDKIGLTYTRSTEDERIVILNLSESGKALKKQAEHIPQQMACCMDSSSAEKMSKEERKALYDALYKFMDILEHR